MSVTPSDNPVDRARICGILAAKPSKEDRRCGLDYCREHPIQEPVVCRRYLLPLFALLAASVSWLTVVPLSLDERRGAKVRNKG